MFEDSELLRRYVEEKSEAAFAELVRRRVDLVYSVALRQVGGDAHLAEDVTQKVFVDLARKAAALAQRPVLSGWLYRSTQFAASDVVRSERRRRAREQESQAMQDLTTNPGAPADWDKLRPLLDEAMAELSDDDRDAVVLRYFEGRAFAEIGRALRLTEEAARKRVERALERMAGALSRRGVTSTSAAVGVALGANVLIAAPATLAPVVTAAAMGGAAGVGGLAALTVFMSSMKVTFGAGVAAVLAVGASVYQGRVAAERAEQLENVSRLHAAMQAKLSELEQRAQAAEQRAVAAEQRAKAAEDDNERLLTAVREQSAAKTAQGDAARAAAEPLTRDQVDARWRRAQELAKTGDPKEALSELLWCFDAGMRQVSSYSGVRRSFLLSLLAKLGETHPEALQALHERRDAAERRLMISEGDYDAVADFGAINQVLKDAKSTLAVFEKFPPGDRRRQSLASSALDELVEQRRYAHAMEARTFQHMVRFFDSLELKDKSDERRRGAVNYVAKYVEILAGVGDTANAKEFARRVLAVDASAETRILLENHAARAGHPRLLDGLRGP